MAVLARFPVKPGKIVERFGDRVGEFPVRDFAQQGEGGIVARDAPDGAHQIPVDDDVLLDDVGLGESFAQVIPAPDIGGYRAVF